MAFVLGVIPARGGSKGIPNKNIAPLGGEPLIAHTIIAAQGSRGLSDVILSTDSKIISECAARYGLNTPSLRPAVLATDTAKNIDAVIYEVKKYELQNDKKVDVIVLLQPTAPLRTSSDIDRALDLFFETGTSSLISVYEANFVHPNIMYFKQKGKLKPVCGEGSQIIRRQEFQSVFVRNGALYIVSREQLIKRMSFVGKSPTPYIMPREKSINIDEPYDLEIAEWMMGRHAG